MGKSVVELVLLFMKTCDESKFFFFLIGTNWIVFTLSLPIVSWLPKLSLAACLVNLEVGRFDRRGELVIASFGILL